MLGSDAVGCGCAREALRDIAYPCACRATKALVADAFSPDSIRHSGLADTLTQIDPDASQCLPVLLQTLRENGGRGCKEASEVMARFGLTVVPQLRELLDSDDKHARDLAFCTLWMIGTPAVDTLAEALRHRNLEVRRCAPGWLRNPNADVAPAVPDLVRALGDDDKQVRTEASHALSEVGPAAIPALEQLLNDPDADTRELAKRILCEINALEEMKHENE
jgi:HEAT repeat protein